MSTELNRDNFDAEVLQAKEPVLVDFWGPRCKPCLALTPFVEQLEKEFTGKLKVTKINAEQNRMLCAKLQVMSLPTFLFYEKGAEIKRLSGQLLTGKEIKEALTAIVK
jgi:thioredoxin 1